MRLRCRRTSLRMKPIAAIDIIAKATRVLDLAVTLHCRIFDIFNSLACISRHMRQLHLHIIFCQRQTVSISCPCSILDFHERELISTKGGLIRSALKIYFGLDYISRHREDRPSPRLRPLRNVTA
jgi:hypothetical protein